MPSTIILALLLAVEPATSLGSQAGLALIELFASRHKQQSIAIVIVTHDASIASRADRTIRLTNGRLED